MHALQFARKGLLALQIMQLLLSMHVIYRPSPLFWHMLMRLHMLKLIAGKGHQNLIINSSATECCNTTLLLYVLYRTLVC